MPTVFIDTQKEIIYDVWDHVANLDSSEIAEIDELIKENWEIGY